MNIEKTCEPRQPDTAQGLQPLRGNVIHSWHLTTASVSCTRKLDKASSESSDLTTDCLMLNFRSSSKHSFHRPTTSLVKVSSSPVKTIWTSPCFSLHSHLKVCRNLVEAKLKPLSMSCAHLRFCFHDHTFWPPDICLLILRSAVYYPP